MVLRSLSPLVPDYPSTSQVLLLPGRFFENGIIRPFVCLV